MRRKQPLGLGILLIAILPFNAGGCMGTLENGLDLVLGIGSQSAAQIAPYLSLAAPAIFFGRLMNLRG